MRRKATLEEMIVERVQPEVMILLISLIQEALDHLGMTRTHTNTHTHFTPIDSLIRRGRVDTF